MCTQALPGQHCNYVCTFSILLALIIIIIIILAMALLSSEQNIDSSWNYDVIVTFL